MSLQSDPTPIVFCGKVTRKKIDSDPTWLIIPQVTVDKGVPIAEDDNVKGQLFQQLIELGDLILEGYKSQLESFPPEAAGDGALAQRRSAVLKQVLNHLIN